VDSIPSSEVRQHRVMRCPKCGAVTDRVSHCFEKGPPLFPQMDDYTITEPCVVVERDALMERLNEMRAAGDLGRSAFYRIADLMPEEA
jgi:hypothetical protein